MRKDPSLFDFDNIAQQYDKWYETYAGKRIDYLEKRALEAFLEKDSGKKRLLEVGCGTGHWCDYFAQKGYRVTGIDISEKMISKAVEKDLPNTSFVICDASRLPFKDNAFDIVVSITTLEFVPDPARAVSEMFRCLSKGGTMLVAALNLLSYYGIIRKMNKREKIFANARFFTWWSLKKLLSKFGKPHIVGSTFITSIYTPLPLSHLFEELGASLFPFLGNFLVGGVKK